VTSFTGLCWI